MKLRVMFNLRIVFLFITLLTEKVIEPILESVQSEKLKLKPADYN